MHRGGRLRRLLLRTGGAAAAAAAAGAGPSFLPPRLLPRAAACDPAAPAPSLTARSHTTTGAAGGRKKRGRGAVADDSTGVPAKIDLGKALGDMKEASEAAGGALKGDEALALAALLARELVTKQTRGGGGGGTGDRADPRLRSTLVSPPVSAMRTRERSRRFLEYATLCENVYDLPEDKDWQQAPPALGPVDGWKLLASHPGGVCIPRYVVLRVDGGAGVRGRRRTRRLLVVVRGTADVTDAAINIAMCPGSFTHQGQEHQCHQGIVEAAAFLERMVRPVIWRELDAIRAEGHDPGHEVEVVFTGHSLGGGAAAVAALELQGEFGPRVPVRSVGFSTPASLSESLACAPLMRRIVTTCVLGDDVIPRCSTKNLQELKARAKGVTVDAEVERITAMVMQDLARRSDEWSRQLAQMLRAKASEAHQAVAPKLPALPGPINVDVGGLKAALGGVLAGLLPPASASSGPSSPQQQQQQQGEQPGAAVAVVDGKAEAEAEEVAVAAVVEEALAEYQEALDAEIQYVKDQLERLKRGPLQPLFPADLPPPPASQSAAPAPAQAGADLAKGLEDEEDEEDEEEDEEKEEAALFAAHAALAATRRALDPEAVQKALQQLLGEKASVAASSVKAEAETRVRALLSETTRGVEEVRGKAAATVSWVRDSLRGLQRQAKAALPSSGRQPSATTPAAPVPAAGQAAGEEEEGAEGAWFDDESPGVALYPPGEIFWIRPLRPDAKPAATDTAAAGAAAAAAAAAAGAAATVEYELRRVRDVHFFDGIVLSPNMFAHHLLTSVIRALKETENAGRK